MFRGKSRIFSPDGKPRCIILGICVNKSSGAAARQLRRLSQDYGGALVDFRPIELRRPFVGLLHPVKDAGTGMNQKLGPGLLLAGNTILGPAADVVCLLVSFRRRLVCAVESNRAPPGAPEVILCQSAERRA
ncbi:hypothetical protein EVAR_54172_1 [Eumeta japonica]|uniref:Uncharacterized protein n=1 Tax=Eumeta variegata TaxID=151549 RepID=A0A4C1Y315_EUMVA|nr:hypothetical protein EVAR_54172_1 [Eumeta japonica]